MKFESFLLKLENQAQRTRLAAEGMLLEARSQGREHLNAGEAQRYDLAKRDLDDLTQRIADTRAELARCGSHPFQSSGGRALGTAGRLAPLHFAAFDAADPHRAVIEACPRRYPASPRGKRRDGAPTTCMNSPVPALSVVRRDPQAVPIAVWRGRIAQYAPDAA